MDSATMSKLRLSVKKRIQFFAASHGYPIEMVNWQRVIGPKIGATPPPNGTEIFVTHLPTDLYEDELYSYFSVFGDIYKIRLMLCPSEIGNRGYAYITFCDENSAKDATRSYCHEIRADFYIYVHISYDNRRIFIGGLPDDKSKDEIWKELVRCGMREIQDIIMYRSYTDRRKNRGFVFVEFPTHQSAAIARADFRNGMLFGRRVQIDWSTPLQNVDEEIMNKVKKLFIRNLPVLQTEAAFAKIILKIFPKELVEKVYKHKDYAFVHFYSRWDAERALKVFTEEFKNTDIEVEWAKPASRGNTVPAYQRKINTYASSTDVSPLSNYSTSSEQSPQLNNHYESFFTSYSRTRLFDSEIAYDFEDVLNKGDASDVTQEDLNGTSSLSEEVAESVFDNSLNDETLPSWFFGAEVVEDVANVDWDWIHCVLTNVPINDILEQNFDIRISQV